MFSCYHVPNFYAGTLCAELIYGQPVWFRETLFKKPRNSTAAPGRMYALLPCNVGNDFP